MIPSNRDLKPRRRILLRASVLGADSRPLTLMLRFAGPPDGP